jgi:hypothetical protein
MSPRKAQRHLTPKQREERNAFILDLFVAGYQQKVIAAHPDVDLTETRVSQIIKDELKRASQDHVVRNANALTIYMSRMEFLISTAIGHVEEGDLKAIEVTRRLMADQAKIYELVDGRVGPGPVPPMGDTELDDDVGVAVEPEDELAAYRSQREADQ